MLVILKRLPHMCVGSVKNVNNVVVLNMHVVLKRLPHLQSWDLLAILPGNTSWHRLALGAAEQGGLLTIWQLYGNYLATIWQLFGTGCWATRCVVSYLATIWHLVLRNEVAY